MTFRNPALNMREGASQQPNGNRIVSLIPSINERKCDSVPLEFREEPELYKLVSNYAELAYKPVLSEIDLDRISEIYGLAEFDECLDDWIKKIDDGVDPFFLKIRQHESISLLDFIAEVRSFHAREMTVDRFQFLAKRLKFTDNFLSSYTHFRYKEYSRQLICQTPHCAVFLICWKPGQYSQPHLHANDLTVIKVYRGVLTYSLFDEVHDPYLHQGLEGKQLRYSERGVREVPQGEWLSIENGKIHQLRNRTSSNLITIHYRYFMKPVLREDNE